MYKIGLPEPLDVAVSMRRFFYKESFRTVTMLSENVMWRILNMKQAC